MIWLAYLVALVMASYFFYLGFHNLITRWLRIPARPFVNSGSVADSYDKWTSEGILEVYWGEHIHLGTYDYDQTPWFRPRDGILACLMKGLVSSASSIIVFQNAKIDFVKKLVKFSKLIDIKPRKLLDLGCGIGGSSRILASIFPDCEVTGISISSAQVLRARELSTTSKLKNTAFKCQDGNDMRDFSNDSFDAIWICESSEHIHDKLKFFREAYRVLKPGGNLILAVWCCRKDRGVTAEEQRVLKFLESEWSHPFFSSIEDISKILSDDLKMEELKIEDWSAQTLPSWRHSILVGVWNSVPVLSRPNIWLKTVREIYTIELMHQSFTSGLMRYGVFAAKKGYS